MRTECNIDMSSDEAHAVGNAVWWVGRALSMGLIVTAERVACTPLAMGNAETVVTVRRRIDHVGEAAVRGGYTK